MRNPCGNGAGRRAANFAGGEFEIEPLPANHLLPGDRFDPGRIRAGLLQFQPADQPAGHQRGDSLFPTRREGLHELRLATDAPLIGKIGLEFGRETRVFTEPEE